MNETNEDDSRSRRRAVHDGGSPSDSDLPGSFLIPFYEYWKDFEEQIEALQHQKKLMLANVRARYGRHQAEALKITMLWMMTDPAKRAEQSAFNEVARRYVDIIATEAEARQYEH